MKAATMKVSKTIVRRQICHIQKKQDSVCHACLVPDKKMLGRFVALRSFSDNTVVASGTDAGRVIHTAQSKGIETPVVMFIPPKKMVCMY